MLLFTATSGQTKVSGRKTNQTVEKTTRVTSSSLPRVKILPWVKIHPDPGGISNQSWILTLVGFATKHGEISFKNADAYVYTGLMLNAQNSFLPSTNWSNTQQMVRLRTGLRSCTLKANYLRKGLNMKRRYFSKKILRKTKKW